MKLIAYDSTVEQTEDRRTEMDVRTSPAINIDFSELEGQTLGKEVLVLNVLRDGEYVRFFIRVSVNDHGRVKATVASNVGSSSVDKSVTAGAFRPIR